MRSTTPHIGAEPSVGPKTVVVGFPRVVIECLLALTERARGGAAAVEGMNFLHALIYLTLGCPVGTGMYCAYFPIKKTRTLKTNSIIKLVRSITQI